MKRRARAWLLTSYSVGWIAYSLAVDLDPIRIGRWPPVNSDPSRVVVQGQYAYCIADGLGFFPGVAIYDVSDPANPSLRGVHDISQATDIVVAGPLAYVPGGVGLEVLDVSNPTAPRRVGQYFASHVVRRISVVGNSAYVAMGPAGLRVLDVSNPAHLIEVGFAANVVAERLFVTNNHAYVADDTRLHVLDVSNPANPQYRGNYNTGAHIGSVFVVGNHAYVGGATGLHILDVSNPINPQPVGGYTTGDNVFYMDAVVQGNTAYFARWPGGLRIIDVSNPASPSLQAHFNTLPPFTPPLLIAGPTPVVGLCLADGLLYQAQWFGGVEILDVSNPSTPSLLGRNERWVMEGSAVSVSGDHAYLADTSGGLHVVDLSDPSRPERVGHFQGTMIPRSMCVAGDQVHLLVSTNDIFSGPAKEFEIIDVSDPTDPHLVGNYEASAAVGSFRISGDVGYVGSDGVEIFDVSDPGNPQFVTAYGDPAKSYRVGFVLGNHAYLLLNWEENGEWKSELEIADVSNPANPQRVGNYGGGGGEVFVVGNHAYLTGNGLEVLDVSDPTNPQRIGHLESGWGSPLFVAGNRAYAFQAGGGVAVFDVSDPTDPQFAGYVYGPDSRFFASGDYVFDTQMQVFDTSRLANPQRLGHFVGTDGDVDVGGLSVAGQYAYLADGFSGVRVIDVSDPTTPQQVGGYDTPGRAEGIFVSGNLAYIADGDSGLQILNINNPANPQPIGSFDTPGLAFGVFVNGNHAYVADGFGLAVLGVTNPANPQLLGSIASLTLARGVCGSGNYAYVAGYGLEIMDVSDPANPQSVGVGTLSWGGPFNHVVVSGTHAYLSGWGGLFVFDVSDPAHPRAVETLSDPSGISGAALSGERAYVASRESGLQVLDISEPANLRRIGGNSALPPGMDVSFAEGGVYVYAGSQGLFILDEFRAPINLRLEPASSQSLGSFQFLLHGPSGTAGRIQRSSNLQSWSDWMPFSLGDVPLGITDATASTNAIQFYRAVSP